MYIKVALTSHIINQSLALHYNNKPIGKKLKQRMLWVPLILLAIAAFLLFDELQQPVKGTNFYMAILYIGFAAGYFFYVKYRLFKAGARMLRLLGTNANFTIHVQQDQLTTTTVSGTVTHNWNDFPEALITDDIVLLYQHNNSFTMLHRSFFEEKDFEVFKNEVRENISQTKDTVV